MSTNMLMILGFSCLVLSSSVYGSENAVNDDTEKTDAVVVTENPWSIVEDAPSFKDAAELPAKLEGAIKDDSVAADDQVTAKSVCQDDTEAFTGKVVKTITKESVFIAQVTCGEEKVYVTYTAPDSGPAEVSSVSFQNADEKAVAALASGSFRLAATASFIAIPAMLAFVF